MDLTNASAIVTGGAGGFGSATVRRLAQMGAKALTVRATRSPTSENSIKKQSEKGRRTLRCSLTEHRNGTFRPILAFLRIPNPRSECCS